MVDVSFETRTADFQTTSIVRDTCCRPQLPQQIQEQLRVRTRVTPATSRKFQFSTVVLKNVKEITARVFSTSSRTSERDGNRQKFTFLSLSLRFYSRRCSLTWNQIHLSSDSRKTCNIHSLFGWSRNREPLRGRSRRASKNEKVDPPSIFPGYHVFRLFTTARRDRVLRFFPNVCHELKADASRVDRDCPRRRFLPSSGGMKQPDVKKLTAFNNRDLENLDTFKLLREYYIVNFFKS